MQSKRDGNGVAFHWFIDWVETATGHFFTYAVNLDTTMHAAQSEKLS